MSQYTKHSKRLRRPHKPAKSAQKKTVSVVIRVRDGAKHLRQCLPRLSQQETTGVKLEIILVDNESKDDSVAVASAHNCKVLCISRAEFSWGRALNRGISQASGEIVILLSADAWPADASWLGSMLEPFEDKTVAAVYARQIPRQDAVLDERVRLSQKFGCEPIRYDRNSAGLNRQGQYMSISNAAAAIRKDIWQWQRFDENIEAGEEGPWVYEAVARGYSVVYTPRALVYHSHREGAFSQGKREWEILEKSGGSTRAKMSFYGVCRGIGAFVKRRLKNCVWPGIPLKVRFSALLWLPWEAFIFAAVGLRRNCIRIGRGQ